MRAPRLFLVFFLVFAATGNAGAQLVINPPEPITETFLVQVIDIAANDGSDSAPLFGTASQQAAIFSAVNQIWAQAGIQINFEFLPGTWNNTCALTGTSGAGNMRPPGDLGLILAYANEKLNLDPNANHLFMVQIVPSFPQEGSGVAAGYSNTGSDGMSMWIGPTLPLTPSSQDIAASVISHEIGRNLGLTTDTTDSQNLMNSEDFGSGSAGELLTESQISTARQFATPFAAVPSSGPTVRTLIALLLLLVMIPFVVPRKVEVP